MRDSIGDSQNHTQNCLLMIFYLIFLQPFLLCTPISISLLISISSPMSLLFYSFSNTNANYLSPSICFELSRSKFLLLSYFEPLPLKFIFIATTYICFFSFPLSFHNYPSFLSQMFGLLVL